jgi:hypothetical protein
MLNSVGVLCFIGTIGARVAVVKLSHVGCRVLTTIGLPTVEDAVRIRPKKSPIYTRTGDKGTSSVSIYVRKIKIKYFIECMNTC